MGGYGLPNPNGAYPNGPPNLVPASAPKTLQPGDPGYDPKSDPSSQLYGMPTLPDFIPATTNGVINDSYKMSPSTIAMPGQVSVSNDPTALNQIQNYATSQGPSTWLQMQMQNEAQNKENALNQTQAAGGANMASAESNLAMRGGLSSGARERVQKSGSEATNSALQNVRNQSLSNENTLGIQDESNKLGLLTQIPGMELQNSNQAADIGFKNIANTTAANTYNANATNTSNQFNISNALNDLLQKRGYDANAYNQQIKAWAAGKTADATGSGGKK